METVCYSEGTIPLKEIKCGAPQGSILVPLLSLKFVDDFQQEKSFLNSIMFTVETNIFFSNSNIKELFENVNKELANVSNWCVTNKLSINKSKITDWNTIPLKLPDLKFNNIILKRVLELKFLGVMVDKNLN